MGCGIRSALALGVCLAVFFVATPSAWAQCTKDTDCKGSRICENGRCVSPGQGNQNINTNTNNNVNNVNLTVVVGENGRVKPSPTRDCPKPLWEATVETRDDHIQVDHRHLPNMKKCERPPGSGWDRDYVAIIGAGNDLVYAVCSCEHLACSDNKKVFSLPGIKEYDQKFVGKPVVKTIMGYKYVFTVTRITPKPGCWVGSVGGPQCVNAQVRVLVFDSGVNVLSN